MFSNAGFEADLFNPSPIKSTTINKQQQQQQQLESTEFNANVVTVKQQQQQADKDDEKPTSKTKICLRKCTSILLSQLGTFVLVICYVIMGGFLFEYLELENEISSCDVKYNKFSTKRNEVVDRVYNMAQGRNSSASKAAIFTELTDFSKEIFTLGVDPHINCTTLGQIQGNSPNWNFANSVYFCATLITTIGYGHIAPSTTWGQIVCMIYGILGIPVMLLFLTKVGEPTAVLFKGLYLNICCCRCFVKNISAADANRSKQLQQQQQQEQWRSADDGALKQPPTKVCELIVVDDNDGDNDDDDDDDETDVVNIPITVTILLLILYILLGAAVFRIWENWTLVEGTYFSFITLSTIGFGDLVPGKDGPFDSNAVITELLVAAVYCIFGLTVLSMCINLIQDEISAKLSWIGIKLGIVQKRHRLDSSSSCCSSDSDSDSSGSCDASDDEEDNNSCAASSNGSCNDAKSKPAPYIDEFNHGSHHHHYSQQQQQHYRLHVGVSASKRIIAYDGDYEA